MKNAAAVSSRVKFLEFISEAFNFFFISEHSLRQVTEQFFGVFAQELLPLFFHQPRTLCLAVFEHLEGGPLLSPFRFLFLAVLLDKFLRIEYFNLIRIFFFSGREKNAGNLKVLFIIIIAVFLSLSFPSKTN